MILGARSRWGAAPAARGSRPTRLRSHGRSLLAGVLLLAGASGAWAINPTPEQLFYVPFPEDQLLAGLQAIESGGPSAAPTDPVTTYISIAAVADNTIIYYDQW